MLESEEIVPCADCGRVAPFCVCEFVTPITIRTKLVLLQHPQEPGMEIGTAPIVSKLFPQAVIKTGLSWPNLKKVLGREVESKRWGVLYMGSVHVENLPKDGSLFAVDKKGALIEDQRRAISQLEGLVVIDGTWSQAKALWWRNAWLLKLQRLVLNAGVRSIYDQIRKEPRKGCLSTLESAAAALAVLEKRPELFQQSIEPLTKLVEAVKRTPGAQRPQGKRKDYRRRSRRPLSRGKLNSGK